MTKLISMITLPMIAVFLALPVQAGDKDGRYAIKGAGRMTCEKFLEARDSKTSDLLIYGGWIEGYITAVNNYEKETYDITPWQTTELTLGLVARGCEGNKEARFVDVVAALFRQYYGARLEFESQVGKIAVGDNGMFMYQEILKRVQTALNAKGFDVGTPTGLADERTIEALVAYQKANDLTETGLPDQQTLYSLLLELK